MSYTYTLEFTPKHSLTFSSANELIKYYDLDIRTKYYDPDIYCGDQQVCYEQNRLIELSDRLIETQPLEPQLCDCCKKEKTNRVLLTDHGHNFLTSLQFICDDCDSYYYWCEMCELEHYDESIIECGYLKWNEDFCCYVGTGSNWTIVDNVVQQGLFAVCAILGDEFVNDLKKALLSHDYLIDGDTDYCEMSLDFNGHILSIDDRQEFEDNYHLAGEVALGIQWLLTLNSDLKDPSKATTDWDLKTVELLEEYLFISQIIDKELQIYHQSISELKELIEQITEIKSKVQICYLY